MEASPPRALVVDDDAALRLMMRVNLDIGGFDVSEAATYAEATAAIETGGFAVVLLDVHLDGRTTNDLLDRLRGEGVPVALVTGSADIGPYQGRADAILTKPFDPQTLVEVARALARV
jgi:DNA-binding response OmpR family regulator